jgi:hypothetical protein
VSVPRRARLGLVGAITVANAATALDSLRTAIRQLEAEIGS